MSKKCWRKKATDYETELKTLRSVQKFKEDAATRTCSRTPASDSKQVAVLEAFMARWDKADWVTLMLAVLARNDSIYGDDDQRFMIYDISDGDASAFEPVFRCTASLTSHQRDLEIFHHIEEFI